MKIFYKKAIMLLTAALFVSSAINAQVNMDRYITFTIQEVQNIKLSFAADANDTPVKIVSGSLEYNITLGTDWKENAYLAGALTMAIYGNIKKFNCSDNEITALNVSQNTNLTYLDCNYNQISSLDVSQNTNLTYLDCRSNELSNLNVSLNTALTELDCRYNQLSSLDISKNTNLTELDCSYNQLSNLEVSQNTNLTWLYCERNPLSVLDISQNTSLVHLNCSYNKLSSLDVSQNTNLISIQCHNNQLSTLDVSENPDLMSLTCFENPLNTEAVDHLFCSLPDKPGFNRIYILNHDTDANHADVLASNKQNALDKNWKVWYWDFHYIPAPFPGPLHDTDIPATSGDYECGSGISTIENKTNIKLYPNPAGSVLNIESSGIIHKVEVFNFLGQMLDAVDIYKKSCQYNTEKLNKGCYIWQCPHKCVSSEKSFQ